MSFMYFCRSKYKEKIEKDRDTWKASYFKRALDYDGLVFSAPYTLSKFVISCSFH